MASRRLGFEHNVWGSSAEDTSWIICGKVVLLLEVTVGIVTTLRWKFASCENLIGVVLKLLL